MYLPISRVVLSTNFSRYFYLYFCLKKVFKICAEVFRGLTNLTAQPVFYWKKTFFLDFNGLHLRVITIKFIRKVDFLGGQRLNVSAKFRGNLIFWTQKPNRPKLIYLTFEGFLNVWKCVSKKVILFRFKTFHDIWKCPINPIERPTHFRIPNFFDK